MAEQPQWDDEVEEIFVRGTSKLIKKTNPPPPPPQAALFPMQLDSGFLEADEELEPSIHEHKYDDEGSGQQPEADEAEEEEQDARQQLKEAIALSMSFAVNRDEQKHADVPLPETVEPEKRTVVLKRRDKAPKEVLEAIVEEEEEMKAELQEQQRMEDTDAVVVVDETSTHAADGHTVATDRTILTLESEAVRAEDCGDESGAHVTLTVEATTTEEAPAPAPAAAASEAVSAFAPPPTVEAAAVVPPTTASPPVQPRGFVLPSLSSLTSSVPAAKSTNLFFAERQQRQQAAEEKQNIQTSPSQPTSRPPTVPPATSAHAPAEFVSKPAPSSISSSASEPLATWSSSTGAPEAGSHDEHLSELYTEAHIQSSALARQKAKQNKQNQQVTPQMLDECRHLLALFGCPYIVSPAEAEAQCATLETLGLVDGVVTEDSDVFLFGARHVYRNIFEQKKYAERYRLEEVDAVLGLDREDLISLALLLGSDYTEGRARRGHRQRYGDRQRVPRVRAMPACASSGSGCTAAVWRSSRVCRS